MLDDKDCLFRSSDQDASLGDSQAGNGDHTRDHAESDPCLISQRDVLTLDGGLVK